MNTRGENIFCSIKKNYAVTPLVGTILVIAIAVAISVPIYLYMSGMPDNAQSIVISLSFDYNKDTGRLDIMHLGGGKITGATINSGGVTCWRNLEVWINSKETVDDGSGEIWDIEPLPNINVFKSGIIVNVVFDGDTLPTAGDEILVVYRPANQIIDTYIIE